MKWVQNHKVETSFWDARKPETLIGLYNSKTVILPTSCKPIGQGVVSGDGSKKKYF